MTGNCPSREVCEVCDREYAIWSAPSPLWNRVMRGGVRANPDRFAFICPTCFALAGDEQNGEPLIWTLMEEGKAFDYLQETLHQAWADNAEQFAEIVRLRGEEPQ